MKKDVVRIAPALMFGAALALLFAACGVKEGGTLGESSAGRTSHNTGANCMNCHNVIYAGTVYQNDKASLAPNAVIQITQNDGVMFEITADDSGNFYTQQGNPSGGYSATVKGNTLAMTYKPGNGGCSMGGCHDGSTVARIYKN